MSAPYYRKFNKKTHTIDLNYKPDATEEVLNKPVESIGLNPKTLEILQSGKIKNILDIAVRTEKDLYRIQGFSKKSLFDVKKVLATYNLDLKSDPNMESAISENALQKEVAEEKQQNKDVSRQDNRQGIIQENHFKNTENRLNKTNNFEKRDNKTNQIKTFKNDNKSNKDKADNPILTFRNAKGEILFNNKDGIDKKQVNSFRNQNESKIQHHNEQKPQIQRESNELRKFSVNGKFGYKNSKGVTIIPAMYSEIAPFREDLACVESNDFFGYIDKNNKVVIPFDKYECAMSFSEGLACVTLNGKCGYINKNGETVIDFKYDAGTAFENGIARVKAEGKWGTVEKDGTVKWMK